MIVLYQLHPAANGLPNDFDENPVKNYQQAKTCQKSQNCHNFWLRMILGLIDLSTS